MSGSAAAQDCAGAISHLPRGAMLCGSGRGRMRLRSARRARPQRPRWPPGPRRRPAGRPPPCVRGGQLQSSATMPPRALSSVQSSAAPPQPLHACLRRSAFADSCPAERWPRRWAAAGAPAAAWRSATRAAAAAGRTTRRRPRRCAGRSAATPTYRARSAAAAPAAGGGWRCGVTRCRAACSEWPSAERSRAGTAGGARWRRGEREAHASDNGRKLQAAGAAGAQALPGVSPQARGALFCLARAHEAACDSGAPPTLYSRRSAAMRCKQ